MFWLLGLELTSCVTDKFVLGRMGNALAEFDENWKLGEMKGNILSDSIFRMSSGFLIFGSILPLCCC